MNPTRLAWTALLIPLLAGCPTKTIYYDAGTDGGEGGAGAKGGQAGQGPGEIGGGAGRSATGGATAAGEGGSTAGAAGRAGMPGTGGTSGTGGSAGAAGATGGGGTGGGIGGFAGQGTGGAGTSKGGTGGGGIAGTAGHPMGTGGMGAGGTGTGGSASTGAGGSGGVGAATAPRVVSVFPPDGQAGVAADVQIVLTFSVPMNQNAVKLAYSSSTLLAGQVTFSWDSTGKVLTITPKSPLSYATGTTPTIAANSYSYQISTAATDLNGVGLASPISVTFSTLKRVSTSATETGVYTVLTATPDGSQPPAVACTDTAKPGQQVGLAFVAVNVMYVTFAIPKPPMGLYAVETATLVTQQLGTVGDPYGTSALNGDQISYESPPTFADNTATPIRSLGILAKNGTDTLPTISVLPSMQDAFSGNGHNMLFRFQFSAFPSTTAYAEFSCTVWTINYTYLTP